MPEFRIKRAEGGYAGIGMGMSNPTCDGGELNPIFLS